MGTGVTRILARKNCFTHISCHPDVCHKNALEPVFYTRLKYISSVSIAHAPRAPQPASAPSAPPPPPTSRSDLRPPTGAACASDLAPQTSRPRPRAPDERRLAPQISRLRSRRRLGVRVRVRVRVRSRAGSCCTWLGLTGVGGAGGGDWQSHRLL